jgi:PAS domain S-box-containing protein
MIADEDVAALKAEIARLRHALAEAARGGASSLQESEERFRAMADSAPAPTWVTGEDGIQFVNTAFCELAGLPAEQLLGDAWTRLVHPDDLPAAAARRAEAWERKEAYGFEARFRRADGDWRWMKVSARPRFDAEGRLAGYVGMAVDLTEMRQAQDALHRKSIEQEAILAQLAEGVIIADPDGRITFVNQAAARIHGVERLDVTPDAYSETYHLFTEDGRPYPPEALPLARAVTTGVPVMDKAWRIRTPDGRDVLARGSAAPVTGEDGARLATVLTLRDETARADAEARLRASEAHLRALVEQTTAGVAETDLEGRFISVNDRYCAIVGRSREALLDLRMQDITHHADLRDNLPLFQRLAETGEAFDIEKRYLRPDGGIVWVRNTVSLIRSAGAPASIVAVSIDITPHKQVEDALRESEARFRNMADHAPVMLWMTDPDGACTYLNRAWYDFTGQTSGEAEGFGWLDAVHPDDRGWSGDAFVRANEQRAPLRLEYRLRRRDGAYRWAIDAAAPRFAGDGAFLGYIGSVIDIDERREVEDALRQASGRLDAILNNTEMAVFMMDDRQHCVFMNKAAEALTGYAFAEVTGRPLHDVVHHLYPDGRHYPIEECPIDRAFPEEDQVKGEELFVHKDGHFYPVAFTASPLRDEQGRAIGTVIEARNISEDKARDAALQELNQSLERRVAEEVAQRAEAEEALRQAQKMETLGQLTGGVAHDFNNLLQIVSGNLELLQRGLGEDQPRLRRAADNAARGAERAAVLTQRLLAFSRRQPLAPKPIEANQLVAGMTDLLHRTLGETVEVETRLAAGLWPVEADPHQLENAILNLAINGRDAMSGGGRLVIATANARVEQPGVAPFGQLPPGDYVAITVTDGGVGMDAETLARACEPFFTTKDVGKGTGLGLSMVYGFAKQSGGDLLIESAPGVGTSVRLCLPRRAPGGAEVAAGPEPPAPRGRGDETILVCEDDEDVRAFTVQALGELGYGVLEAADGPAALRLLERQDERVDLLFTDVVLPGGMSGAEMASRARALRPGLKILYTTGYARDAIVHGGRLDPGVTLIAKPFSHAQLAQRVREMLDG